MKICFLLQRRFAYLAHYMAQTLREQYSVDGFCGYVYQRSSYDFLKKQKEVEYSDLLLDEEIHAGYKQEKIDWGYLKTLEKEYGLPNLWPYLALDRVLMHSQPMRDYPYNSPKYSYYDMLRIFQRKARAILQFMDKEKPDAIFFPNIGGVAPMLFYQLAKKRGIKILHMHTSALTDKYLFSESYDSYTGVEQLAARNAQTTEKNKFYREAQELLSTFRNKPQPYYKNFSPDKQPVSRFQQLSFVKPKKLYRSLSWFLHIIKVHFFSQERFDYSYVHPWNYLVDRIKRKTRNVVGVADLYDKFDPNVPYAFYGLHYEPEISLMLLSPFNQNQIEVIKHFARSLPVGYIFYVKEHPQMVPFRQRSYYKELKKIPNVRLLNPAIKSFDIITRAKLIATIAGTIGWEAVMLKKPVISIGHTFYNYLSMVSHCSTIEELPNLVNKQLNDFKYNEEEITNYIAAILEESADLQLIYLWEQETDQEKKRVGLIPFAHLMAKKLGLEPTNHANSSNN